MPEFLTTREFDTWRGTHDEKIDRLLTAAEAAQSAHHQADLRLASLEHDRKRLTSVSSVVANLTAAVVGGIVGGIASWWGR